MGIEIHEVTKMMMETSKRIDKATRTIYDLAKAKAETERIYRQELAKEIYKQREAGVQATLISDVARGNIAFLKYERDLARDVFNSAKSSLEALKVEASVLQTVSKYTDVID